MNLIQLDWALEAKRGEEEEVTRESPLLHHILQNCTYCGMIVQQCTTYMLDDIDDDDFVPAKEGDYHWDGILSYKVQSNT